MKSSLKENLRFSADDVNAALDAAWKEGLLCGTCMQKIETQNEMSQSDFCAACQAAFNSQHFEHKYGMGKYCDRIYYLQV